MIQFKIIRPYTHVVKSIRFPLDQKRPFLYVYFSENSTFLNDYPKLDLKLIDFRLVVVPMSRYPYSRLVPELIKSYRANKLQPYSMQMKVPEHRNLILDPTNFLSALDNTFRPTTYRQRAGMVMKHFIENSMNSFPQNYHKVLVYSVDLTKDVDPNYINRKFFPFLKDIKNEEYPYDSLLLCTITDDPLARFRLLIKDKDTNFQRLVYYVRTLKGLTEEEEEQEKETEKAADDIVQHVKDDIGDEHKEVVKSAVKDYLKIDRQELEDTISGPVQKNQAQKVASTAILYRLNTDVTKSQDLINKVPTDRMPLAFKAIYKAYSPDLLQPRPAQNMSTDPSVVLYDVTRAVDNKNPAHVFQKRQIDFETNLIKDMTSSFKVLEAKEIPLKFENISIREKEIKPGELYPSDISTIEVHMTDEFGNKHKVEIDVPRINPDTGTFRLNGKTKCLINQIIQKPITFPAPGESRFESSYSTFRIYLKKLRKDISLESFMVYRMPFAILLFFAFGFEETMKLYGIKYEIFEGKPKTDEVLVRITPNQYVVFKNITTKLQQYIIASFIKAKVFQYRIEGFPSKEYFEKLVLVMTGRLNSTFLIMSHVQNVVDPIVKQILTTEQLPTDLPLIMKYMAQKVVDGFTIARNDISNQRIRNSEILVHLVQKQLLAAYTVYKEQILAGNKRAKLRIVSSKALDEFLMTELVVDMEYVNPMEEMSTITRISPVGKKVLGIPDKRAISHEARNVHQTYFGNIDPLDTPEGDNIGIVQQLTIDPKITSARGLIAPKDFSNEDPSGILSTTTCMVPFIENNEGARVIMISQQAKQMVPLKNPSPPAVRSGYESILTGMLSDKFIKRAPCTGKIARITENEILFSCEGKYVHVDISPQHLRSGTGKDTVSIFNPTVRVGQSVRKGAIIAEGSCISQGSICLGRNLAIAIMPYKGYNYEDGVVINEKLTQGDAMISLHGVSEEILLSKGDRLISIANIGDITDRGEPLVRKTIGELEQLLGYEEDETIDVVGNQYVLKSPGGRVIDIEVYSNVSESTFPQLKELINRTNRKRKKPTDEMFTIGGRVIEGVLIKIEVQQMLRTGLGDKLCNRFGNKGIISLVEKDELMPRTPFGERIDMIINPLGIINRMNVGQLYELYCGLISRELGRRIITLNDKSKTIALLKPVLEGLDKTKNKLLSTSAISSLRKYSDTMFRYFVQQIKSSGFYPLIIPPFKGPKYNDILSVLKMLGLKTSYPLYLPEFGTKTYYDVPFGYMYISKLEHLGDLKIYARSTGPTTTKTGQPTAGKRHEGGQRLGEADTYCFISYNCTNLLAEMMGPLSDDFITKNEIISEIIQKGSASYREPKFSPTKDLLNAYFTALMLERT